MVYMCVIYVMWLLCVHVLCECDIELHTLIRMLHVGGVNVCPCGVNIEYACIARAVCCLICYLS